MNDSNMNLPFPLFINLKNVKVLVVGAGKIAQRRIKTLLGFSADITVVSKEIQEDIKTENVKYIISEFKEEFLEGISICLACTNDRHTNKIIGDLCKKRNIHHSICDRKEECSFFFPGIEIQDNVVVAVCGDGSNHKKTKDTLEKIRNNTKKDS